MKLFTVKLTDEERAALEAYRARHGLRSEADAVRSLIAASVPTSHPATAAQADWNRRQSRAVEVREEQSVVTPTLGADGKLHMPERKPYQKTGKK